MNLFESLHNLIVHSRRVKVLCRHLVASLPNHASVLDVGCGDGQLSKLISKSKPDIDIQGIDILVRKHTYIPVRPFDGIRFPYEDKSVDAVIFVDVLHHTEEPTNILKEAKRVARTVIIIKDHVLDGFMAEATLRLMDWVGNALHGVALPYNYWSREQWEKAFGKLDLTIDQWDSRIGLYPIPADWIFGRDLHFIARLLPGKES